MGSQQAYLGDPAQPPPRHNSAACSQLSPLFLIGTANHTDHIATTFLSALPPVSIMAGHDEAQDVAATSDEFRELAKDAGLGLNVPLQGYIASADKSHGFVIHEIEHYVKILQKALLRFQEEVRAIHPTYQEESSVCLTSQEISKLHPGSRIRWHKYVHVITDSEKLGTPPLSEEIRDLLMLPVFIGEGKAQDKIVGQPLSFKASFHLVTGDILLFYKSVPAS